MQTMIEKRVTQEDLNDSVSGMGLIYIKCIDLELYHLFISVAGVSPQMGIPKRFYNEFKYIISELHKSRENYEKTGALNDDNIEKIKKRYQAILLERCRPKGVLSYEGEI